MDQQQDQPEKARNCGHWPVTQCISNLYNKKIVLSRVQASIKDTYIKNLIKQEAI